MASTHQFVADWSVSRFLDWASGIDSSVGELILKIIDIKNYTEQAYKSCLGALSFEKKVGKQRLINACKRVQIPVILTTQFQFKVSSKS